MKNKLIRKSGILAIILAYFVGNYTNAQNKNFKNSKTKKMKITPINITPDTYAPFNLAQGHRVGDLLFISGQTALDDSGQLIGLGNFDVQAQKAFENLDKVLKAGGSSLKNVVKVTILLRDMGNFNKIVALREKYFTKPYPADTIFEVSSLFSPDALIEIEATAVVDEAADWQK